MSILFYICSMHAVELTVTQTGIILMAGGMLREYLTRAVRNCLLVVAVTNSTNPTGILRYAQCTPGFVRELSPQCKCENNCSNLQDSAKQLLML